MAYSFEPRILKTSFTIFSSNSDTSLLVIIFFEIVGRSSSSILLIRSISARFFIHSSSAFIKSPLILNQDFFNKTLDLYPEFNRPNIIKILNYLKHKKQTNMCHKIMIYTNNQGANDWAKMIISYFE